MPSNGVHRGSVRQILRSYQQGLTELQREIGDNIVIFEFDHVNSSMDDTYDEGQLPDIFDPALADTGTPGRVYRNPTVVPAIWIRFVEPSRVATDEGEYLVSTLSFRASIQTMRRVGLEMPVDPSKHFNDRFSYNGFLYRVDEWQPRGWLLGQYMMVDVVGTQVKTEEIAEDAFPFSPPPATSLPWTPGQALDWPNTQPQDVPREDDGTGTTDRSLASIPASSTPPSTPGTYPDDYPEDY